MTKADGHKGSRIFGGRVYQYQSLHKKRQDAVAEAERFRNRGYLARVVPWRVVASRFPAGTPKHMYEVWIRRPLVGERRGK